MTFPGTVFCPNHQRIRILGVIIKHGKGHSLCKRSFSVAFQARTRISRKTFD